MTTQTLPVQAVGWDTGKLNFFLAFPLDEAAQAQVRRLLEALAERFGDDIYLPEAATLHVTVLDVISGRAEYTEDRDQLFARVMQQHGDSLASVFAATRPFTLHFGQMEATPGAIIIRSQDENDMMSLRLRIQQAVAFPPGANPAPSIVHSTLARFTRARDLQEVQAFLASQQLSFTVRCDTARAMCALMHYMPEYQVMREFPLAVAE